MYSVNRFTHEKHGSVIHIERAENGRELTPFQAVNAAMKERRLWQEAGVKKVRFLVDDQVMSHKQVESWAREEYASLPKCPRCAKILSGDLHTHRLSRGNFFCSESCSDQDYLEEVEKLKDEEEIDYL